MLIHRDKSSVPEIRKMLIQRDNGLGTGNSHKS